MEILEKLKVYIINYKKNIIIVSSYILIFLLFSVSLLVIYNTNSKKIRSLEEKSKLSSEEIVEGIEEVIEQKKVVVDVKGAVKNPGIYEVDSDKRVNDQTTPNMIQRIIGIFERKPLISKEI